MVDKNVITPLYAQIANELRKEILSGKYGSHGCIGTHSQLGERFGVSLITVRKAVQVLEKDGIVEILQGKGTFVRQTALVDPLRDLTGISNMMSSMQMEKQVSVPVFELRPAPETLDRDTAGALGDMPLFIRRVEECPWPMRICICLVGSLRLSPEKRQKNALSTRSIRISWG